MIQTILTLRFGAWILVGGALCVGIYLASRHHNRAGVTKTFQAELFRAPTANVLTTLGLLVPVMIGLLAYLFERNPLAPFSFLAAAISFCLVALVVSVWESFALISVPLTGANKDQIELTFSKDRPLVTSLGIMYTSLLLSICYLCCFLLFEMGAVAGPSQAGVAGAGVYVGRPHLLLGTSRAAVTNTWGQPFKSDTQTGSWTYITANAVVTLAFDPAGNLMTVTHTRKDTNGKQ